MSDVHGSVLSGNPGNPGEVTPPAAQPPVTPPAGGDDWRSGFDEQQRGFIDNKGWAGPADMLESYRNLESFVGAKAGDKGIVLPESMDDAEGWNEVFAKLGRPEKADGYQYAFPDGHDPEFAGWVKETFHAAGLSDQQLKTVADKYVEMESRLMEQRVEGFKTQAAQAVDRLRMDWGQAFQQNLHLAGRAVSTLGIDDDARAAIEEALGSERFAKTFLQIGQALCKEDSAPEGEHDSRFALSPAAAQERLSERMADESFVKRYLNGESTALAEMERLHKAVAAGKQPAF